MSRNVTSQPTELFSTTIWGEKRNKKKDFFSESWTGTHKDIAGRIFVTEKQIKYIKSHDLNFFCDFLKSVRDRSFPLRLLPFFHFWTILTYLAAALGPIHLVLMWDPNKTKTDIFVKELSLCHKLKFSNSFIFAIWWCKPFIFRT